MTLMERRGWSPRFDKLTALAVALLLTTTGLVLVSFGEDADSLTVTGGTGTVDDPYYGVLNYTIFGDGGREFYILVGTEVNLLVFEGASSSEYGTYTLTEGHGLYEYTYRSELWLKGIATEPGTVYITNDLYTERNVTIHIIEPVTEPDLEYVGSNTIVVVSGTTVSYIASSNVEGTTFTFSDTDWMVSPTTTGGGGFAMHDAHRDIEDRGDVHGHRDLARRTGPDQDHHGDDLAGAGLLVVSDSGSDLI